MSECPAGLDALLGSVAANLPDEEAATAKARANIARLEKAVRAAEAKERAELRESTLRIAAHHLLTAFAGAVYEDAGQRTAEGVTRAADELLRLITDPNAPTVAEPPAPADRAAVLLALVRGFLDPDPCQFDHHGYCQAHAAGFGGEPMSCPHHRAREVLAEIDGEQSTERQEGPTLDGAMRIVESWFVDVNDGHGFDASDLVHQLQEAGYRLPSDGPS